MDRSTNSSLPPSTTEAFTAAQVAEIRTDLETIMNAHLDITDDKVAEQLQFFNKAVNTILSGTTCDPRLIEKILFDRFHMNVSGQYTSTLAILFVSFIPHIYFVATTAACVQS